MRLVGCLDGKEEVEEGAKELGPSSLGELAHKGTQGSSKKRRELCLRKGGPWDL